jgi:hypothetical protein
VQSQDSGETGKLGGAMPDSEKMFELAEQLRINAKIDETDYRLSELMAESETQNFTRGGVMFYLVTKTRASAVAGCKEELFAALRREGYGELVTETVNANSLSSFVKEQIEENEDILPDWLSGLVNVFEKTSVGVRKASKKQL